MKDFLPPKRGCVSRENTRNGRGRRRKQEKPRRHTPDRRDGVLLHQYSGANMMVSTRTDAPDDDSVRIDDVIIIIVLSAGSARPSSVGGTPRPSAMRPEEFSEPIDLRHTLFLQLLYPMVVIIGDCRSERHRSRHSDLS
jgi:hypothetical protein